MGNLHVTYKYGEVGKELEFTLTHAVAGTTTQTPYNLDNWTVTLTIAASETATPVKTGLTVTKRTQSGATLGQCYHTLTDTVGEVIGSAKIPYGTKSKEYKACELKLVNGSQVRYWPVNENNERTYFTVEVQKSMS